MADGDDGGGGGFLFNSNVSSVLAGMGSALIVLLLYRCMSMFLCIRHPLTTEQEQARSPPAGTQSSTLMNSVAHMIPSHKYDKKDDDCTTCAVCLGEFEEGFLLCSEFAFVLYVLGNGDCAAELGIFS
ncbi:uncharacterized protein LOC107619859 [Arachis ipaensis]|uniref:uncharacterized protein LOC107619859 n=1 Tax=Arachis ipaensis TaxID=130454 RepID=UPI0007AF9873|nr:uncharacterized protein LOC107619859 [Arachis ipaensis]